MLTGGKINGAGSSLGDWKGQRLTDPETAQVRISPKSSHQGVIRGKMVKCPLFITFTREKGLCGGSLLSSVNLNEDIYKIIITKMCHVIMSVLT